MVQKKKKMINKAKLALQLVEANSRSSLTSLAGHMLRLELAITTKFNAWKRSGSRTGFADSTTITKARNRFSADEEISKMLSVTLKG